MAIIPGFNPGVALGGSFRLSIVTQKLSVAEAKPALSATVTQKSCDTGHNAISFQLTTVVRPEALMNARLSTVPGVGQRTGTAARRLVIVKAESTPHHARHAGTPLLSLLPQHLWMVRRVRRGRPVYLATDDADSIYFLREGSVKLVRFSRAGDEVMIDRYRPGSWFGNLCFCNGHRRCDGIERDVAVALEDCEVIVTTFESLKRNIDGCPEKLWALLQDYCHRLAEARMRIESFVLYPAEDRLAHVLLLMTEQQDGHDGPVILNPPITHAELAHWIGVTRPFVTRLMRRFRNHGFIEPLPDGHLLIHREKIACLYS